MDYSPAEAKLLQGDVRHHVSATVLGTSEITFNPCCLFGVDAFSDTPLSSGIVCVLLCFVLLKKKSMQYIWKLRLGNECQIR
jgi:hypothetical protein